MNKLDDARSSINKIDKQMAALFEERMAAVKDVAEYKKERGMQIFDESREREVISRNSSYIENTELKSLYVRFMQDVMDVSKQYQHQLIAGVRVAYSGVEGAFANIAAKKIFPDGNMVPYPNFNKAYEAVVNGECEYAVLPIENSYAGEVGQVMDLMFSGNLYVNGVYSLRVAQNLLGVRGATISDVKKVISHPQALDQCASYIDNHGFEKIQSTNTAQAARQVSELNDKSIAAIASAETAALYNLDVLDHDINESDVNVTRFAVFSRVKNDDISGKDSNTFLLMFTVKNEAGALAEAIAAIGRHDVNMRVLRSRPLKGLAWQYYFYVEAEGKISSKEIKDMTEDLEKYCGMLKILGHYPIDAEI